MAYEFTQEGKDLLERVKAYMDEFIYPNVEKYHEEAERLGHSGFPAMLDELCTSGEVVWAGAGAIGSNDGRVRLCFADQLALLAPSWEQVDRPDQPIHESIRSVLEGGGAMFWGQLRTGVVGPTDDELLTVAGEWARRLASGPTIGIGHVKGQINSALEQSMEQVARDEVTLLGLGVGSDSQEAMLSFVEKREPRFTGR